MANCKDCLSYGVCNEHWLGTGDMPNLCSEEYICKHFKDRNRFVELPFKVGSKVFVTPDRGNHFHKATLYGCDEKGTFLVFVNDHNLTDEEKPIVANPCTHVFYDWFIKVYTKEEAEQALKERENGTT